MNFVTDGLYWVSSGGHCLYAYQDCVDVGKAAKKIAESYFTRPLPDYIHVDYIHEKPYTFAVTCTKDGFLVMLVTSSITPQSELGTVVKNIADYFRSLQIEKPSSLEFPLSITLPVDLAPWEKYEKITVDQNLLDEILAGKVFLDPTEEVVAGSIETNRITPVKENIPTPHTKRYSTDIFQRPDRTVYQNFQKKAIATMSYIYPIDMAANEENIAEGLTTLSQLLTSRGVGMKCVDDIIKMTQQRCIDCQYSSWTGPMPLLKREAGAIIKDILRGVGHIDLLEEVLKAKMKGKVYKIAFLGVNGVGKSSTLSKVAYLLAIENKLKTLVIACDCFRAGAVEQLHKHATSLGIDVYDQGYGKVSSSVAKYGIIKAQEENYDVALIDTAGRMQDNEPLMMEIAKLVDQSEPDLIIMLVEGTVGNDGEHQLTKFKESVEKWSSKGRIDGLILTKMDVAGERIGLPITLAHQSKLPVVFVGVGQSYQDLQPLCIDSIVNVILDEQIKT